MKRRIWTLGVALIAAVSLTACFEADYNGSRTGNDSQLIMEFSIFNTTDSQLLELEAGDVIEAEILRKGGRLSVVIGREGEEPIYVDKDAASDTFTIPIETSGTYRIKVTGRRAVGRMSFVKSSNTVTEPEISDESGKEFPQSLVQVL